MPLPDTTDSHRKDDMVCIKREPLYVWLARLTWVIVLVVLLEYALQSHQEREPQAAITTGAICVILLLAGVIVEVVRHIESQPESRRLRDMARANSTTVRNNGQDEDVTANLALSERTTDRTGDKDVIV